MHLSLLLKYTTVPPGGTGRFSNKASQKTCQVKSFITELSGEKPETWILLDSAEQNLVHFSSFIIGGS